MSKKMLVLFVLVAVFAVSASAEVFTGGNNFSFPGTGETPASKNTLALSVGVIGAELSYERALGPRFSVLGSAAYTNLIFGWEFAASAKARWYPFGGMFHLELGAGYMYGTGIVNMMGNLLLGILTFGWYFTQVGENVAPAQGGFLLQPGLGWKIDIGKPGGVVLPISAGLDIRVTGTPEFMPYLRAGLGYSF